MKSRKEDKSDRNFIEIIRDWVKRVSKLENNKTQKKHQPIVLKLLPGFCPAV
jgi:hypothetical protein